MTEKNENKEQVTEVGAIAPSSPDVKRIVAFRKPYQFEGKEYKEIDLSGIDDLSGDDLIETEKIFSSSGGFSMVPELSPLYAFIIASRATKQPVEFFSRLPIKDGLAVKNAVVGFLNS